jgi:CRP-like cAMP-binding protein
MSTYVRVRNSITGAQVDRQRVPKVMGQRLQHLEQEVCTGLRGLNPGLFQRFSDSQVLRMVRAAPICNYAQGSWIFTRHPKEEHLPPPPEYYLLCHGQVDFYERSPHIGGDPARLLPGMLFAEGGHAKVGGSVEYRGAGAQAMSTVCVIVLSRESAGHACAGDRLVADKKYANIVQKITVFNEIPIHRLENWLSIAQIYKVTSGQELLSWKAIEDSFLIMVNGKFNWCADVTLTEIEEVEKQTNRRKVNIFVEAAEGLRGGSIFDKMDPYCVVKFSPQKQFQTKTMLNAGRDPYFHHTGTLVYDGEEGMEFTVYDWNEHGTHDVLGTGFIPAADFQRGFEGEVKLTKPQQHSLWGGAVKRGKGEDHGGVLLVMVTWGDVLAFRSVTKHKDPRKRTWPQVPLLDLGAVSIFGHEQILLGDAFLENVSRATHSLGYTVELSDFRITSDSTGTQITNASCLRIPRANFENFMQRTNKLRDMLTHAVNSSIEKQTKLRETCYVLIQKWMEEERRREQQKSLTAPKLTGGGESLDVNKTRRLLKGALLTVQVVSALSLVAARARTSLIRTC